jgi:acetoin utilization deacetylase AcuC-like enzyme
MQQSTKLKLERLNQKLNMTQKRKLNEQSASRTEIPGQYRKRHKKCWRNKKIKDIKCDSTVQVGEITSSSRSALARSRLLQVHNAEYEGEMQQVSKNDGEKKDREQNSSPQQGNTFTQLALASANIPVNFSSSNTQQQCCQYWLACALSWHPDNFVAGWL